MRGALLGGLLVAVTLVGTAKDYPLQFKTLKPDDLASFPGGSGAYGQLLLVKPANLKEPRASSRSPLYGTFAEQKGGLAFRCDESKGTGKGYDHLIVDLNQNNDLTDDPPAPVVPQPSRSSTSYHEAMFGPIILKAQIGGGRPIYYVRGTIYLQGLRSSSQSYLGQFSLKPGWYLETTIEQAGQARRLAIIDANANLRLGDISQMVTRSQPAGSATTFYFRPGDLFLVDENQSGKFDSGQYAPESSPFGPLVYAGGRALRASLAADFGSVRVEPWAEPLVDLSFGPQRSQVQSVSLAWQPAGGEWSLIKPAITDGKAQVPPGNYRLVSCVAAGNAGTSQEVIAQGYQRRLLPPLVVQPGRANMLRCGDPLQVSVTTRKTGQQRTTWSLFGRAPSEYTLQINADVVGAGEEIYSSYAQGKGLSRPPNPTFTITDQASKPVASGKLEYG